MEKTLHAITILGMNTVKPLLALLFVLVGFQTRVSAQYLYRLNFKGTVYQTNAAGVIYGTPVTDKSILHDIATANNLDPNSIAMAYHVQGTPLGDTVDIINANTGVTLDTFFGLYFGSDADLGRMALTNGTDTAQRRIDYIYTSQNSHSMGAAFVSKGQITNDTGAVLLSVQGLAHWVVAPKGSDGLKLYSGAFTTGKPLTFSEAAAKSP